MTVPDSSSDPVAFVIDAPDAASAVKLTRWCCETLLHLADCSAVTKAARQLVFRWNPRMRSAAGRAYWPVCRIEVNPAVLSHSQLEAWTTIRHELAHLLAYARYGRGIQPHGPEWKRCCIQLGIPGESRTHKLPLPCRRMSRNFHYACPNCGARIAKARPFKRPSACAACCRTHNRGRFDKRFLFQPIPAPEPDGG